MDHKLMEYNYKLLPSEEIPDCCISCSYSTNAFKRGGWILICFNSTDGYRNEAKVCNFGKCDKYNRRKELI